MAPLRVSSRKGTPMTTTATATGPTGTARRHDLVDALRGAALLGILVVNIEYLAQPIDLGWTAFDGGVDLVVRWLVATLALGKFFPIFSLLFGYGLALQTTRAGTGPGADASLRRRTRRRFTLLAVLGVVHGVLFFPGDILLLYALVGAVVFRARTWPTRRLLVLAITVHALTSIGWLLVGIADAVTFDRSGGPVETVSLTSALLGTSVTDIVAEQGEMWIGVFGVLLVIQGPVVVSCFAAGLALGRTDWLADPERQRQRIGRLLRVVFPPALAIAGFAAWLGLVDPRWEALSFGLSLAVGPAVAAGFIAALAVASWRVPPIVGVLRHAGRMSLTVYLAESVLAAVWAYGLGFGRLGRGTPLGDVGIAVTIWVVLSAVSVAWMRRFRFGPLEWLLRWWSYGRRPPLRRSPS